MARSLGRACIGKQTHATKAEAQAHRRSLSKLGQTRNKVYRCDWCCLYHVGRRGKRKANR